MTSSSHESGTERCAEVIEKMDQGFDVVINIQGDEPFISPDQVDLLAQLLSNEIQLATLVKKIDSLDEISDPNEAKVVRNSSGDALYFSRSPIPFQHGSEADWINSTNYYKHVGIYAYRTDVLEAITKLPVSSLELAESLEQLRWLEHGFKIKTGETSLESMCIDTPEDIEEALERYNL